MQTVSSKKIKHLERLKNLVRYPGVWPYGAKQLHIHSTLIQQAFTEKFGKLWISELTHWEYKTWKEA